MVNKTVTKTSNEFTLENLKTLCIGKSVSTHELTYSDTVKNQIIDDKLIKSEFVIENSYKLRKIDAKTLTKLHASEIPGFVFKDHEDYYYAEITKDTKLLSKVNLGKHMCAQDCCRLSAASDEKGGCEKVRNRSNNIEMYDWITLGYETFNTSQDCFVVLSCDHYCKSSQSDKKRDLAKINSAKLGLAQYVWDDVTSLDQVRKRRERNRLRNGSIYY